MSACYHSDCLRTLQDLERLQLALDIETLVRITDLKTFEWLHKVGVFKFVNNKGEEVNFGRILLLIDPERIEETGRALENVVDQICVRTYEEGLAREAAMFGGAR